RKPIAGTAAYAFAIGHVPLIEHDPTGSREGMKTRSMQIVKKLLHARLIGHGGIRIGCARRGLGRVHAAQPVDLIHLLGLGVEGLQVVVADGPSRRDPVVFAQFSEVLATQAVQGRAVHFGGSADKVVDLWLERFPVSVVPGVGGDIAVVYEYSLSIP